MNPLIPLLVIVPLAGAFLIMVLGKVINDLPRYFTPAIMLFLLITDVYALMHTGSGVDVYKVGGWEPAGIIPIGIYMILDGYSVIMLCVIGALAFFSSVYSISYIQRYTGENTSMPCFA